MKLGFLGEMLRYLCLTLIIAHAWADLVSFQDCDNNQVKSVDINGISSCTLSKEEKYDMSIEFVPDTDCDTALAQVSAKILPLRIPFTISEGQNACSFLEPTCPLKQGMSTTGKYSGTIPNITPSGKYEVTLKIESEDKSKVLACACTICTVQ